MKSLINILLIIPSLWPANEASVFQSSCGGVKYKVESYCKANDLSNDQDKLGIPICKKNLSLGEEVNDLSNETGLVERINHVNKKIKMMNFVFYGASCKKNKILLSGYGECNSCSETFKQFNFSGKEIIKDNSIPQDLEPMQEIIPDIYD